MRGVSFRPRPRPYPLLGLGSTHPQQQQGFRRGPSLLAPAAGTRAADAYRRALATASPELEQSRSRLTTVGVPLQVFGIRGVSRKSKKGSTRKRSRKRTTKRLKSRVTCKVQLVKTASGKRVRRTVCRNSSGRIVSNKKKRSRRK